MNEASVTAALLAHLRQQLPGAQVFKLSDRTTGGIPDVCITWAGDTWWLEIKLLKSGDGVKSASPALQRWTMCRLSEQSSGRAFYVVYDARKPKERRTAIYPAWGLDADDPDAVAIGHWPGFHHEAVVDLLRRHHEGY